MSEVFIISELALFVGLCTGWLGAERFRDYLDKQRHDLDELFEKNPHPECFEGGKLNKGEYLSFVYDDDEEFDDETKTIIDEGFIPAAQAFWVPNPNLCSNEPDCGCLLCSPYRID